MHFSLFCTFFVFLRILDKVEYDKPFLASGKQIIRLGINFSSKTRCVDGWKMS